MKPFLLLSIRAEEPAAEDEYDAFCRFLGVGPRDLHRLQLGAESLGRVSLDTWSGILLGGGAYTFSDPEDTKPPAQRRAEAELVELLDQVVAADFPFLGACYGIGTLGNHQGGTIDRTYPEPVGPLSISLTDEGLADPLFADVPRDFAAYGGHKEALTTVPPHLVTLATSPACPVQAFRAGEHVYATQFHPELDLAGVHTRIDVYSTYGYFDPSEVAELRRRSSSTEVIHPMTVLRNFSRRYRSESKS